MSTTASPTAAILLVAALAAPLAAQERVTVLKGATVHPVDRASIENGVVILAGGKIQLVGDAGTTVPSDAVVVDCTGKHVTPGLVNAATTLGVTSRDANEQGDEVTPTMRILDAVDPADKAFERARGGGVTTVQVSPGNRNVIGGLGAVLKTAGDTVADMLVSDESCLRLTMGGEPSRGNRAIRFGTPRGIYYRRPTTRMGVVWGARKAFYDAMAYREQKTDGTVGPQEQDPGMDVLVRVLDKKLQVRTTARAEQDIRTALRLAEEFGYDTVIEEATEAYQVPELLADAKVKVVVGAPSQERDTDSAEPRLHTLNLLHDAGVPFAIATGSRVGADDLGVEAMFALRNGLPLDQTLRAVTLIPAQIIGVADRVGSLTAGKDADVVVWNGAPFGATTTVDSVWIDGVKVH